MNPYTKLKRGFLLAIPLFLLFSLNACQEEEFHVAEIQFQASKLHVAEGSEAVVVLVLNRAAEDNGSIQVGVETNAIYGQHFTSEPELIDGFIEIIVLKGQKTATLKIKTIDNAVFENSRFIILSLSNPSEALRLGNLVNYLITIDDDEGPSLANFVLNAGIVKEKEVEGIAVQINLSAPAQGTGSVVITMNSGNAIYEKDFIINPKPTGNSITLDFQTNETSKSFTVLPVHNFKVTQSLQLTFTITSVFGVIQKGNSLSYSLTILNEDVESLVNFAANSGALEENNTGGITIEIPFSAQAPGEGSISISFTGSNASYGTDFTTIPPAAPNNTLTLYVTNKQEHTSFKVFPINNTSCSSQERSIRWTISVATGSLKRGNILGYELSLIDDEKMIHVNFAKTGGSILENDVDGIEIKLNFSEPAAEDGILYINSHCEWPGYYEYKFTTKPATYCDYSGYLPLSFTKGSIGTQFEVFPINNNYKDGNFIWLFNNVWSDYSNCVQLNPNSKYILSIVDDD